MANHKERIGVSHCNEIAESNNWMFREQPIDDVGIAGIPRNRWSCGLGIC